MAKKTDAIYGIAVQGFKSIAEKQEIEFRPLTILAGANSSGKSSFMQPLLLLKQTLESAGDPGALLLDGPNVRFTSAVQLLSRKIPVTNDRPFSVHLDLSQGDSLEICFKIKRGEGLDVARMIYSSPQQNTIDIVPGMSSDEISGLLPDSLKEVLMKFAVKNNNHSQWAVSRDRCFLGFNLDLQKSRKSSMKFWAGHLFSPGTQFIPFIQSIIHLPGLRGNPLRNYPKTGIGPHFPGTFEMYVANLIYNWQQNGDKKLAQLGQELEALGLTWKVTAKAIADTQVELQVGRLPHSQRGGAHDLVSIADVGFGVSQSLPVLVALIVAQPGQMVYLEQPEIHLHPKAQRLLAHTLCRAATRGVMLVVETHSSLLLREIQTLIARKEIARENVRLHWFERNEDGSTKVTTADIDENGAYGDWPQDFDTTELDTERSWLDAVEKKLT
jgi:hypothetical protein